MTAARYDAVVNGQASPPLALTDSWKLILSRDPRGKAGVSFLPN